MNSQELLGRDIIFTDWPLPRRKDSGSHASFPYGLVYQPFANQNVELQPTVTTRCSKCGAYDSIHQPRGSRQCIFCNNQLKAQPKSVFQSDAYECRLKVDLLSDPCIFMLLDLSSMQSVTLLREVIKQGTLDTMLAEIPNMRLQLGFYGSQTHLLEFSRSGRPELVSYTDPMDIVGRYENREVPPLHVVLPVLKCLLDNVNFEEQLLQLSNGPRHTFAAMMTAMARAKVQTMASNCGVDIVVVSYGADASVTMWRNVVNDEDIGLLSLLPEPWVQTAFDDKKVQGFGFTVFLETDSYVDAANYAWLCNKTGRLYLYEPGNPTLSRDLQAHLAGTANHLYAVQTQVVTSGYSVASMAGPGVNTNNQDETSCVWATPEACYSIVLSFCSTRRPTFIQLQTKYQDAMGIRRLRVLTASIYTATSQTSFSGVSVLAKLMLILQIAAGAIFPRLLTVNNSYYTISGGLKQHYRLIIDATAHLITQYRKRPDDLNLTLFLRGIYSILHTNIFSTDLSCLDSRIYCAHRCFTDRRFLINAIAPQVLVCPITRSWMHRAAGRRYVFDGYCDISILRSSSTFAQNEGYNSDAVAVMLNANQTQIFIIMDDRDSMLETCDVEGSDANVVTGKSVRQRQGASLSTGVTYQNTESNLSTGLINYHSRLSILSSTSNSEGHQSLASHRIASRYGARRSLLGQKVASSVLEDISTDEDSCTSGESSSLAPNELRGTEHGCRTTHSSIVQQSNVQQAIQRLTNAFGIDSSQTKVLMYSADKATIDQLMYETNKGSIDDWILQMSK